MDTPSSDGAAQKRALVDIQNVLKLHRKWLRCEQGGTRADLTGAVLTDADLTDADLTGADLTDADLTGADLTDADLTDADLTGADLTDADLTRADLTRADLTGAVLTGVPVIENIHAKVYEAASQPGAFSMRSWHQDADGCEVEPADFPLNEPCGTTHCRAGWVVTLAGEAGRKLEERMGTGPAAALIYIASDPKLTRVPNFYASDHAALEDMRKLAGAPEPAPEVAP